MRSVATLLLISIFVAVVDSLDQCSSVGVSLCYDTSTDLCEKHCTSKGSSKASCTIFDNSLRVQCDCTNEDVSCLDTFYNSSETPTCTSYEIYGCNNACTDLCRRLPNTKDDGQGRSPSCNPNNGKTKCMCDSLPVCDDAINDPPAQSPTGSTDSGANQASNPEFAVLALSITLGMINLIF